MFFLQIARAPITVMLGQDLKARMSRFTLDEVVAWGQELYERNLAAATKGMDDVKRREYMTFYQPIPPDLQAMKQYLRTPEGIKQIVRTCLAKAEIFDSKGDARPKLSGEQIERMIDSNGTGRLAGLAIILADLDEQSIIQKPIEDEGIDPLTESGRVSSGDSPKTGESNSQSSTPVTPDSNSAT